jgi:hypothetical protein
MSTFKDQFSQIQPCDNRNLIQVISQILTQEVVNLKSRACDRFNDVFTDYGLGGVRPCEILTDEFLEQIQEGNVLIAIDNLLLGAGFPPYIIKVLTEGIDSLTQEEEQKLINWLLVKQGVRVHPDTSRYTRYTSNRTYTPTLTPEEVKKVEDWYISQGIQEIQNLVTEMIYEFIASKIKCPPKDTLDKLVRLVNNLISLTNRLQSTFDKLQSAVNIASSTVSILSNTIDQAKKTIAANDIAIAGAVATGVGIAVTPPLIQISTIVDRQIRKYEPQVDALDATLCTAAKTVQYININITVVRALLEVIDALLKACIPNLELGELNTFTQSTRDTARGISYEGYFLEVRTSTTSSPTLPQRYAVALDEFGTVVLQGPRSYSSSTQVLLEELKFRIDNQLG